MGFHRASGILLHPTCLPGPYGIGELGLEAYRFVDFLIRSGQRLWQILPLGPPGPGNSPYTAYSTAAGNPLLISLERLIEAGLLEAGDLRPIPNFPEDRIDFAQLLPWKLPILRTAYRRFAARANALEKLEFEGFCRGKAAWLEEYTLFMALRDFHGEAAWTAWPRELRARDPQALQKYRRQLSEDITYYKFLQFEFFRQWSRLKQYAHDQNLEIIGDLPIYVAHNSVDVWADQEVFQLDPQTSEPLEVAGVPPDYFSKTGQLWGNPLYDWKYLESTGFDWWIRRIRDTLTQVDLIRIDHFRGLESYWSVPAGEDTAMNGRWVRAPGYALFNRIREDLGYLPIIAEDLGIIGPEVIALRDHFGFPGMNILHFAFDTDASNPYLPHNLSRNSLIYAGTHDNNTTTGWFSEDVSDEEKAFLSQYLGPVDGQDIAWNLIRLAISSVANQALITLQDVLALGSEARMNRPGEADGNWAWRYRGAALTQEHSERLQEMAVVFGRHEAR